MRLFILATVLIAAGCSCCTETELSVDPVILETEEETPQAPTSQPVTIIYVDDSTQHINTGDTHVTVQQQVQVVEETQSEIHESEAAEEEPEVRRPRQKEEPVRDERCERLRRQHEARVEKWERLFD